MNPQTKKIITKKINNPPKDLKDVKAWAADLIKEVTGETINVSFIENFEIGDIFSYQGDTSLLIVVLSFYDYGFTKFYTTGLGNNLIQPYYFQPVGRTEMVEHLNSKGYVYYGKLSTSITHA